MSVKNHSVGTKVLAYLWGAFPLRVAGGLMMVAIIATVWSVSNLEGRQQTVNNSMQKLQNGNVKEKNASVYLLMEEARRQKVGNFMENAPAIREIYNQVIAADPKNAGAYVELAKLDLMVSQATEYKDPHSAVALKETSIAALHKAQAIYQQEGLNDKSQQTRKVIADIQGKIAPYNWCFPTTGGNSVPGTNCSKL